MKKADNILVNFINIFTATSLAVMAILVFLNVIMRYVFNSGLTWSEEIARFLFIWLTFLGAVAGLQENQHLGVDSLVKRLSRPMKKAAFVLGNLLILFCLWFMLEGSWEMVVLNKNSLSPALEIPLSYVYGIGLLTSVAMGLIIIFRLYRVLFTNAKVDQFDLTVESEELIGLHSSKE